MPVISVKPISASPPSFTDEAMSTKNLEIELPPRSAVIPSELIAVATAKISGSVAPNDDIVPTKFIDISTISRSEVAKLFPR